HRRRGRDHRRYGWCRKRVVNSKGDGLDRRLYCIADSVDPEGRRLVAPPPGSLALPAELNRGAGAAIAVLLDMAIGVLAELEQAAGVVVAVLLQRAVMAIAFLMND